MELLILRLFKTEQMNKEDILFILFYFFIALGIMQFFFYSFFYSRVIFWKKKQTQNTDKPDVSVIIAAKNESENLKKNLAFFLEQDYPSFNVIVVNDASVDDSATVLAQFKEKYPNLYVTSIPYDKKFQHGKKMALSIGIKAAKTDILLFSDADCKPMSNKWIETMVSNFDENTDFVIGAGMYENKRGFLNKIIRSDTMLIAIQYLSLALAGIPYMAVGRNMAYRKSIFTKTKGFSKHANLLSGSDDLFVNNNANRKNTKIELSPESLTISEPKTSSKKWFHQKIRHLTTGKYYKFKHKFLLSLEVFTRVFFVASGIVLLAFNQNIIVVSSILSFLFILFLLILFFSNKKLKQRKLLIFEFIFYLIQPILNFILYLFASKKKELLWK